MAALRKLEVRWTRASDDVAVVGQLAQATGRTYFEYDPAFLRRPVWLSPFKLPPAPGLHEHRDREFGPLPGLFDDSLPDGWGLLLMDRFLRQRSPSTGEISALDRLAFLGTRTMGALTYHPPTEPSAAPQLIDLQQMARASAEVLRGPAADVLPELMRVGGSPGGARPKVLVGVGGDEILSGEEELPAGFEHWLVKFPAREDDAQIGRVELAYARLACEAGVVMPPTRLFETVRGEAFFGVRRFDRVGGRRLHVHTFGNLIHANFRVPSCDYRQLLDVTRVLTRKQGDVLQAFRRMVFNVLGHNRDDDVKNFGFRMQDGGEWELAPAYDLIYSTGPGGEHTMTVDGEGKAPARRHLLAVAEGCGISASEGAAIYESVAAAIERWPIIASEAGVASDLAAAIGKAMAAVARAAR